MQFLTVISNDVIWLTVKLIPKLPFNFGNSTVKHIYQKYMFSCKNFMRSLKKPTTNVSH